MNKELIDKAWACLPKEFKEEVKYKYNKTKTKKIKKECDLGFLNAHEGMFGAHNLTSDTEGEEMLTAMKWKVQEQYANYNKELKHDGLRHIEYEKAKEVVKVLYYLFGSKCLPDNIDSLDSNVDSSEPKPAEPKFKVGDKVRVCSKDAERYGKIGEVIQVYPSGVVDIDFGDGYVGGHFYGAWAIEPYTEPTANYMQVDYHGADTAASTIADCCQSQPVTDCHDFDRIVKDGFRGHNRLHIAAQIVAALYANHQAAKGFKSIEEIVRKSLDISDTLIKESEKVELDGRD